MSGGKVPKGYRKGWRPCTCHPDDNPPAPCARRYSLSECRAVADTTDLELAKGVKEQ